MLTILAGQVESEGSQREARIAAAAAAATPTAVAAAAAADVEVHVVDLTSPPRSQAGRGSAQGKSRKGRARRRACSLGDLMKGKLLGVGDELVFQGAVGVVVRDGWMETSKGTVPLEAFVVECARQNEALSAAERSELMELGRKTYEQIVVQGTNKSLWDLSESLLGAATTLKTEEAEFVAPVSPAPRAPAPAPAPAPEAPSSQQQRSMSPVSLGEDSEPKEVDRLPSLGQAAISTQLPDALLEGGSQNVLEEPREEFRVKRRKKDKSPKRPAATASSKREIIILDDSASPPKPPKSAKRPRGKGGSVSPPPVVPAALFSPPARVPSTPVAVEGAVVDLDEELERERRLLESNKKLLERRTNKAEKKKAKVEAPPPVVGAASFMSPPAESKHEKEDAVAMEEDELEASIITQPVLLGSNLSSQAISAASRACAELGGCMVTTWAPYVTHVVIPVKEGKCARTLKYCMAVLSGTSVVCPGWIAASHNAGMWLEETPYLACDDRTNNGHNAVEASLERYRHNVPPLFAGTCFAFHGAFDGTFSKHDLASLVQLGGGTVVETIPARDSGEDMPIVICEPSIPASDSDDLWRATGRDPVFYVWLFDCTSDLALLPTRYSDSYKKTFNEEAAAVPFATQHSPAV
jgi:hypothetical protein